MNAQDLEQRARDLLAAELEAEGDQSIAIKLRRGDAGMDYSFVAAIRAIVAALRHQPAPVVDDAMVERALNARAGNWPVPVWQLFACEDEAREIMRIALTAALARAQGVQS